MSAIERAAEAIVQLINARPHSPSKAEITSVLAAATGQLAPSPLNSEIARIADEYLAAIARTDFDEARVGALEERLAELGAQLEESGGKMCRVADVVSWAHCALVWADRDALGRIRMLTPEAIATADGFDTAVANLLLSALRLGELEDRQMHRVGPA